MKNKQRDSRIPDLVKIIKKKCEIYEVLTKKCANMCTLIQAPALGLSSSSFDSESNATDHNLRPASTPLSRAKSSARPHFPAAMRYLSQ